MKDKKNTTIAIVCGGPSPEARVSRLSADRITPPLEKHYGGVVTLELNTELPANLLAHGVDVVFPVAHGPMGEDGCLQGLLEVMSIPYIGSGVLASACALDKVATKRILQNAGIPLAKDCLVSCSEPVKASAEKCLDVLGERVVIKPFAQGSGIGVQFSQGEDELIERLTAGFEKDRLLLVEEFIQGREVTAGILDLEKTHQLPVIEIITPNNVWYDYTHRYTPGLSEHIIPAGISDEQSKRVQEIALQAHQLVRCRDISRSDFIVPEEGEPIFSEINNLPGMTPTSLFPDGAKYAGIEFETLICGLVDQALKRGKSSFSGENYWPIPELNLPTHLDS